MDLLIGKGRATMPIQMGDDEFIHYIRKQHPECHLDNAAIGRKAWRWIRNHDPEAHKVVEDQPCYWRSSEPTIAGSIPLPKTATQFSFSRALLPDLYDFLDEIGETVPAV